MPKEFCQNCGTVNAQRYYGCGFWFIHFAGVILSVGLWLLAFPFWFLIGPTKCPKCGLKLKEF